MREIKFRGKRKNDGDWVYGAFVAVPQLCAYIYDVQPDGQATRYLIDEGTVGQFTGLNDKDGREIYEGDIVKATLKEPSFAKRFKLQNEIVGEMVFDNAWWIKERETVNLIPPWRLRYYDLTVIGNVHNNPGLLEDTR